MSNSNHQRPLDSRKRIAVLVFLLAVIGVVAWVLSGSRGGGGANNQAVDGSKPSSLSSAKPGAVTLTAIPASIVSAEQLLAATKGLGFPIYWNGDMQGTKIELTVLTEGKVFVRYLPKDAAAGSTNPYFTVASYYDSGAFGKVQNLGASAGAKYIKYKGGAVAASASNSDSNIYFAFDGNPVLYDLYSPDPLVAWNALDTGTLSILR